MASVLVTGAGGFIGSKLVRQLVERGDDIVCLAHHRRCEEQLEALGVRVAIGDIRSLDSLRQAIQGVEFVYHLAGRIRALSVETFREVNTQGMENIARACADSGTPPVLVIVSSLAAGGPSQLGQPRSEADRSVPVSHYGRSKRDGELAAAAMAGEVPVSIVRPPFVLGEGDRTSLILFALIKRWNMQLIPRSNDLELSLIHVDDLVAGLIAVATRGERLNSDEIHANRDHFQNGLYYIGDPQIVTCSELGHLIGRSFDRCVRTFRVGRSLMWTIAMFNELTGRLVRRAHVMNLDKFREAIAPAWTCCSEKIRVQLDFVPAIGLAERIQQTSDWYLREGWL